MEVKIKMYDTTITWQEEHDDLSSDELLGIFERLMYAFGYHPDSIKRSIIELAEEYKDEDLQRE